MKQTAEECCLENIVPRLCLGLCKEANDGNVEGMRTAQDIFGITNLGRCTKHLEAIQKCKNDNKGKFMLYIMEHVIGNKIIFIE